MSSETPPSTKTAPPRCRRRAPTSPRATVRAAVGALGLWVVVSSAGCAGPSPGNAARGKELFVACAACHGADGAGNTELQAPNIAGLPEWYVEAQLRQFLNGHRGTEAADTSGRRMTAAAQTLTRTGDVPSVAAYVAGLPARRPPPTLQVGDPAQGKVAYQACASCHRDDGKGKLDVPPVIVQADWYLLAQLRKYKKSWRGTNEGDLQASRMRAVIIPLDDTDMENVVAYIGTLR